MAESIVDRLIRNARMDADPERVGWKGSNLLAAQTQAAVSKSRADEISPWRETWSYGE